MKKINSLVFILSLLTYFNIQAQEQSKEELKKEPKKKEIEEIRLNLNEDGSHYVKATILGQMWFMGNQSNPGTTVLGDPNSQTFNIAIRRVQTQVYGTLTDHVGFYIQFGENNFGFLNQNALGSSVPYGNRKVGAFFEDALAEYRVKKGSDLLYLGGGLTITNGLSRFSQASITSIMSLDVPIFAQATVDQTDQFDRRLAVYARGQISKFDYRILISDPFPVQTSGTILAPIKIPSSSYASFAQVGAHKQYGGFFMWNFFDKEPHTSPYMAGTYLGKKKVFNLEGGFITQHNALWTGDGVNSANTKYHDLTMWSVAMFYDAPVNTEKGTAFNAYAGYFNTNYGPGYLRYNGVLNPADGNTTPGAIAASQGNAFPMFGTGQVLYTQIGYLLKKDLLGEGNGTLMPYATSQMAKFDRLSDNMIVYDIGVNWFIKSHNAKFTLDFQNRPVYNPVGSNLVGGGRRDQLLLQYQFFF